MTSKKIHKKKRYAWQPENQFFLEMMRSKAGVIVINWFFQGMLGMNTSELIFKISFDIFFISIGTWFLSSQGFRLWNAWILGFFIGHTVNWLFNTHFWVIGRFLGFTKTPPARLVEYIQYIAKVSSREPSLLGVVLIGNLTRGGTVRNTSDIDIEFIRRKGFLNTVFAIGFNFREKSLAFFRKIPLDCYLYDEVESLNKHRKDETPIILYDPENALRDYYQKRKQSYEFLEFSNLEQRIETSGN